MSRRTSVRTVWAGSLALCACLLLLYCGGGGGNGGNNPPSGNPGVPSSVSGVLTWHYDNARSGANVGETVLTPANVNSSQFGKLFSYSVDGEVAAQPLVVNGVDTPSGKKNVLIVATEHASVYAFDADTNQPPLWRTSFIDPARGIDTFKVGSEIDYACCFNPEIGITGTPVVDPNSGTIYVVAKTVENGTTNDKLHALDLRTGSEKPGSPVLVQASVPGNTSDAVNGTISFRSELANQRPGLLLSGGIVYVAWGSYNDRTPYHGWVIGFRADTLQQTGVFITTADGQSSGEIPAGGGGGIWMSGGAPAADGAGNVYFTVGNGAHTAGTGGRSYSNSTVKLGPNVGVLDFFAPFDALALNNGDMDYGTGAAVLVDQPGAAAAHLVVSVGKNGTIYSVNRDNMGRQNPGDNNNAVQTLPNAVVQFVRCSPAVWNNTFFIGSRNDSLKAFSFANGLLQPTPASRTAHVFPFPGPTPTISSNGTSNGIVWALDHSGGSATLHAFSATDLGVELYNSTQAGSRDQGPPSMRFAVPIVVNGKVYIGGRGQVAIYGLR